MGKKDATTVTQVRAMKGKYRNSYTKDQRPANLVLDVPAEGKPKKLIMLIVPQVKSKAKSTKALHTWDVH